MLIFWILFFLVISAFFSGMEIAYVSANKVGIEINKTKGSRRGKLLARLIEEPRGFLGTMLVGNNIALVVLTLLATALLSSFLEPFTGEGVWLLLANTLIITLFVLLFGEFLPKLFFSLFPNELLHIFAGPLAFFKIIFSFPVWLMTVLSTFILKYIFRTRLENEEIRLTRMDLQHYINRNILEENEIDKEIFENALNLDSLKVRDCLIPRTEIVGIDIEASREDLIRAFVQSNHSRIVVFEGDIENVKGYIHHQHLIHDFSTIRESLVEVPFVPETMNAKDLLLQLREDQKNLACVVDEFGGIAGIITLEDILEEIFGEIEDEYDDEELIERKISEYEFLLSGRLEISDLNEMYDNINLPEGDYQTLSGYIVMTSGIIPEEGEELELGDHKFIFEKVSNTKIELVRLIIGGGDDDEK
jgi:CBS domain containing-hemolysin-like protein